MNDLLFHINKEIDKFAKQYENAPIVDGLIGIKKMIAIWLGNRTQAIQNYYCSEKNEDKISFINQYGTFKIRLTFYRNGQVQIYLEHINTHVRLVDDRSMMSKYCIDAGYVYFIESEFGWKIGKTRNIKRRKKIFEVKLPFKFSLRYYVKTTKITIIERELHEHFKEKRINGEWFLITAEEIKEYIENNPELKLRRLPFEERVAIEKKYLTKINL